jgi:fido (protein-threonine AMPylation protein)
MEQLADSDLFWTDTEAFVIEFLRIHPFEDGNGRTASILLNRRTAKDLFVDLPQIEGWINEAS